MRFRVYWRPADGRNHITGAYDPLSRLSAPICKIPILIHDSWSIDPNNQLISPVVSLEDSAAGSFEFSIAKKHPMYGKGFNIHTDTFYVVRDDRIIWDGRPVQEDMDMYGNKAVKCEGALAYLNDALMPQYSDAVSRTVYELISDTLIGSYNSTVTSALDAFNYVLFDRLFYGESSVLFEDHDTYFWNPNYETTMTWLKTYILDNFQAHCKIVYPEDSFSMLLKGLPIPRYLCVHDNFESTDVDEKLTVKRVDFYDNMLSYSYSKQYDTAFGTSILPRGETKDDTTGRELPTYLYLSAIPDRRYLEQYLESTSSYRSVLKSIGDDQIKYGVIAMPLDFSSVKKENTLLKCAIKKYKSNRRSRIKESINITGLEVNKPVCIGAIQTSPSVEGEMPDLLADGMENLDLKKAYRLYSNGNEPGAWPRSVKYRYTDPVYFDIWTKVLAKSKPHFSGEKQWYVTSMTIPLDNPAGITMTMNNNLKKITDYYISSGAQIGDVAGKYIPE